MELFVYGSLLSGEDQHSRLAGAILMRSCRTSARYTLVDLGTYPALLRRGTTSVCGEVYDVDEATIELIDAFEGHPTLFRRVPIRMSDGRLVAGYALWLTRLARGRRILASGDWRQRGQSSDAGPQRPLTYTR